MRILLILGLVFLSSCLRKSQQKVETEKCVITNVKVIRDRSTIEVGINYFYFTDCGIGFTNRKHIYNIGDTIDIIK